MVLQNLQLLNSFANVWRCLRSRFVTSNLTIYLLAMTDANNQYVENAILYVADNAIVTYPVAPIASKFRACQSLPLTARIGLRCDLLIHEVKDASCCGFVQLCELALRLSRVINLPGQDFS